MKNVSVKNSITGEACEALSNLYRVMESVRYNERAISITLPATNKLLLSVTPDTILTVSKAYIWSFAKTLVEKSFFVDRPNYRAMAVRHALTGPVWIKHYLTLLENSSDVSFRALSFTIKLKSESNGVISTLLCNGLPFLMSSYLAIGKSNVPELRFRASPMTDLKFTITYDVAKCAVLEGLTDSMIEDIKAKIDTALLNAQREVTKAAGEAAFA